MKNSLFLFLIFLVQINNLSFAQTWTNYNKTNSGLASNVVNSIAVDAQNVKWIGTDSGLTKFDGTTWTNYKPGNSGIPAGNISNICIDQQGNKWFSLPWGFGFCKYDGVNWTTYNTTNSGLVNNDVNDIVLDNQGKLLIATRNGISKFDGSTWITINPSASGISGNGVKSLAVDATGTIWVGTYNMGGSGFMATLLKYNGTSWTSYYSSPANYISTIKKDLNNDIFFADDATNGIKKVQGNSYITLTSWGNIPKITVDNQNNKWDATNHFPFGVFRYNNVTDTLFNCNSYLGSSCFGSVSLAIDNSGNKWMGNNSNLGVGINVLSTGSTNNLDNCLVAYYPFNGNANDESSYGNNGIVTGATLTTDRLGVPDKAYSFNGINNRITVNDAPQINFSSSFSIAYWLKANVWANGSASGIVSKKASDGANGYVIYNDGFHPSKINFRFQGQTYNPSASSVELNIWHHWAVTYDAQATLIKIYKDGVLDTTITKSIGNMTNSTQLYFGYAETWTNYLNGSLDEIRLYNCALSPTDIQILYSNYAGTNCSLTNPPTGEALTASNYLCQNNIIQNTQDGAYNATNSIRRKDLTKIVFRGLFGSTEPPVASDSFPNPFGDLQVKTTSNDYYYRASKSLSYLDFGDGITPFNRERKNFYPEDSIGRGYALKVMMEAWNITPDSTLANPFTDVGPGEVKGYILKAASLGLLNISSGTFRPYDRITRQDAFILLHRFLTTRTKPTITNTSFYKPFLWSHSLPTSMGIDKGNFNSYSENCFSIKGVPSLQFSFSYSAAATEMPDDFYKANHVVSGNLDYHQQPLGVGWNHNYNAYILIDYGVDDISSQDNRFLIFWPNGIPQAYNPITKKFATPGVYDSLKIDTYQPATDIPTQITITTKNQVQYVFQKLSGSVNILQLVSVKDRNNNTISLAYENGYTGSISSIKRLKTVSDPFGRSFNLQYSPNSNYISTVTSLAGGVNRSVSFTYNADDLVNYYNAKGDTTTYIYFTDYASQHLVKQIRLPKGNMITNGYNQRKLTSSKYNSTYNTTVVVNSDYTTPNPKIVTNVSSIRDGQTYTQSITTDANNGMPVAIKGPAQSDSLVYADLLNRLRPSKYINQLTNVQTTTNYDARGNLLSISKTGGGFNIKDSFTYNNPKNDVATHIDGNGNLTTYSYNTTGNLTTVAAPIGTTVIAPNTNGTVQQVTNPENIITTFTYDAYGNLATANMPLGITTTQASDGAGRVTTVTNPRNISATYQYDASDNRIRETIDPTGLNQSTNYSFDKNNNLLGVENALHNTTYLTYNNNDQLVKEQLGPNFKKYSYHDDGTLQTFTSPNNVAFTPTYNANAQPTRDGYATYTYNADNSLATIKDTNNQTLTYKYDLLKRISGVKYSDFAADSVGYTYDNNNNIKAITYPGGMVVKYNYDGNNRLSSVTDASDNPWASYTYFADGRLQQQTNRNGTITKYNYDVAGRLDSMANTKSNGTIISTYAFTMDKAGNHTAENMQQPQTYLPPAADYTKTYTHDVQNRLTGYTDGTTNTTPTYDSNGNNLTNGTQAIVYDIKNNITSYTNGTTTKIFEYDGLGQLRRNNTIRYVLDMNQNVLMETDLAGNPLYYYIQGLGMVCRIKAATNAPYYYHYDYRGSTTAITNAAQAITHSYCYGAFGEKGPLQEEDYNAYRYVGKYGVQYEDSSLYFMRARYYNPYIGRFLGEDPVWNENLYPYVRNNPIHFIDFNGTRESVPSQSQNIAAENRIANGEATKEDYMIRKNYRYAQILIQSLETFKIKFHENLNKIETTKKDIDSRKMEIEKLKIQNEQYSKIYLNKSSSQISKIKYVELFRKNIADISGLEYNIKAGENDIINYQNCNMAILNSIMNYTKNWDNYFRDDISEYISPW